MLTIKILLRIKRFTELRKEMSDNNFDRDNEIWLLFVAVSTIVSAAFRTMVFSNRIGNKPINMARMRSVGLITVHPIHQPKDVSWTANDKPKPHWKPQYLAANAAPIKISEKSEFSYAIIVLQLYYLPSRAGLLCSRELSSK